MADAKPKSGLKRWSKSLWDRLCQASKLEFGLNLLNAFATLYVIGYTTVVAIVKTNGGQVPLSHWFWIFCAGIIYQTIYKYVPKDLFKKSKWVREEKNRTLTAAAVFALLGDGIKKGSFSAEELAWLEESILRTMKSQIEQIIGDSEGLYLNVSLLVEPPDDDSCLEVCARANPTRSLHVKHKKSELLVWQAMEEKKWKYWPDFAPHDDAPYRCILAIPVSEGKHANSIAGVSIDSEKTNHFDHYEPRIFAEMLPHLAMLRIVLVCRKELLSAGRPHHAATGTTARRRRRRSQNRSDHTETGPPGNHGTGGEGNA